MNIKGVGLISLVRFDRFFGETIMKLYDQFKMTLAGLLFAALALSACSPTESPAPDAAPASKSDATSAAGSSTAAIDEVKLQAMQWRNIGPFNGGRGTTVVGHPTDPMVFWFVEPGSVRTKST